MEHLDTTHLSQTIELVLNQVTPCVELSWHPFPSVSPGGLVSIWPISQTVLPLVPLLSNSKLPHLQNWGSVVGPVWKCCTCALASYSQGLSNACLPWMDFLCEKANLCIWLATRGSFWMCTSWHLILQSSNPFLVHMCVPALNNTEGRKRERKWSWLYPEHWCETATLICKQF